MVSLIIIGNDIHLFIYLFIYLCIYLFMFLFVYLLIYLFVHLLPKHFNFQFFHTIKLVSGDIFNDYNDNVL